MKTPYPTDCPPDNQREMDNNTPHAAKDWYDFLPPPVYSTNYITWHFNLDDPEGERRLRECLDAPKWKSAVWEFDQWMRNEIKHCGAGPDFEKTRAHLHTVFGEHGIDIWEE